MGKKNTNWERRAGVYGGTCGAMWRLRGTDYFVRHCGHPTALWPYYGLRPDGSMILAPNGRAFRLLADAQAAVERESAAAVVGGR